VIACLCFFCISTGNQKRECGLIVAISRVVLKTFSQVVRSANVKCAALLREEVNARFWHLLRELFHFVDLDIKQRLVLFLDVNHYLVEVIRHSLPSTELLNI